MGPLAELPGWLQAAGWGVLSASGLLIGAAGGYYTALQHTTIARGAASLHGTVMGLLCGAAVFSSVNWLLSRRGAQHRKRCGECVEQPAEEQQPGSGLAIAAGTILALVSETMIPEAFYGSPPFNGVLLVVGFVSLLILAVLSH